MFDLGFHGLLGRRTCIQDTLVHVLIGQFRKIVEAGEPGKVTTQDAKKERPDGSGWLAGLTLGLQSQPILQGKFTLHLLAGLTNDTVTFLWQIGGG